MKDYAFTAKLQATKDCKPSTYIEQVFNIWKAKYLVTVPFVRYEDDSLGKCHAHGILTVPTVNFYLKKLLMKEFHFKFTEIKDRAGWEKYCNKDQKKEIITIKTKLRQSLFNRPKIGERSRSEAICAVPEIQRGTISPEYMSDSDISECESDESIDLQIEVDSSFSIKINFPDHEDFIQYKRI